jgi:hypothetical protein
MKFLVHLFLATLLLSLQGCFEVLEEVNVNPNGSGTLILTINGSQSKSQLDKLMAKDSIGGLKIPKRKEIESSLAEIGNKLKSVKGLSNIQVTKDLVDYILIIKCDFANASALNDAINTIWLLYDKKAKTNSIYFSYHNKLFKRSFDQSLIKNVKEKLSSQEKDILSKATYTCIYRFSSEIESQTNSFAVASKSKKATILKSPVLDIVVGKKSLENEIKIK